MNMQEGWIKLHRQLKKKGYYKKSQYVHLWVHLLLSANHKPKEFMLNNQIIIIKEGQLVTGRKQLSSDIGIPESTTEDILNLLEKEHQIQQQKTTKFRIITIINWVKYQNSDITSDNKPTSLPTSKKVENGGKRAKFRHQIRQQVDDKKIVNERQMEARGQNSDIKSDNRATTEQQQADITSDTNKKIRKKRKNIKNKNTDIAKQSFAEQKINLNPLLEKFEPINPNYQDLFANKTQRAALEDLVRKHTYEKIEATIMSLPEIVAQKYAPRITTPLELKYKLGNLILFVKQNQSTKKLIEI